MWEKFTTTLLRSACLSFVIRHSSFVIFCKPQMSVFNSIFYFFLMRSILRQIVAVLALVGITSSMVPAAFAVSYTAQAAADKLAASNYIVNQSGNPAAYRLADNLLRQEALGVTATIRGVLTVPLDQYVCQNKFSDVTAASGWVCRTAELSANAGLTNAANATFRPKANLSRFEALVFALRAADLVPSEGLTQAALIQLGVDNALITSSAGFNATASATRGEFFQYVVRALDAAETPEICEILGTCTPNPNPNPGNVSASLSASQPTTTLVAGQSGAVLAHITFTGNGTVTGVNLLQTGVSADTTLSNVYLFDGATRLTDAATVSSGRKIDFINASGIFTVNGTKTITVVAEIATGTSGQTVGVNLSGYKVGTGSTISANLVGNINTIATATLATADFAQATPSGGSIDPAADVEVFKSNVSVGTRDLVLNRLAIRQIGSVNNADIRNFRLQVDGQTVATVANLDMNGYASFNVSPAKTLITGTRVIRVLADVVGGASRNFQFSIRNKSDVGLVDSQYNVGISPTYVGVNFPATPTAAVSINAGTVTVQKAIDSTTGDVTVNGNDVLLAKYTLTTYGESLKIETLKAGFASSDGAVGSLRNGRIVINGAQVGSTTTLLAAGTTFTTNYTLAAGVPTTIEIRADLFDNEGTNDLNAADTITASLLAPAAANTQRLSSLGYISVPAANTAGNQLTAKSAASITMVQASTYANQTTAVPQTQSYKIAAYTLAGNSSEDVNIDTVAVDFTSVTNATFSAADLTDVILKVDGVAVGTPKATVSATGNSYSVSFVLPKNGSKTIEIWANIGSSITAADSIKVETTVSGIGASSSVTSTTATGVDGQTIIAGTGTITATADASRPVAAIVDDAGSKTAAAFKFEAATDSFNITDLVFTIANVSTVSKVKLYDGTTLIAQKDPATTVNFNGLAWNIPANTSKVLRVELDLGTVGVGSGTSGASTLVTLTSGIATNGAGSSAAITESPLNPAGNAMYVYKAIPTVTNLSLPTTLLNTGTQTVSKFSIGTNGTGTVGWKKLIFTVSRAMSGTDTLATPTLWDADTNTQVAGVAAFTNSVEVDGGTSGTITFVATDEQQISGSKSYYLKLVTAGVFVTGDNLNVSIAQPSSYAAPAAYATVAGLSGSFVWTDVSAQSHSESTLDWNNGFLVKNLPTDSQTLTK